MEKKNMINKETLDFLRSFLSEEEIENISEETLAELTNGKGEENMEGGINE